LPLVRADWPVTLWRPGDLWRGQHPLRLPGSLESGVYTWRLQLYAPDSGEPWPFDASVELGQLRIQAPQRLWQAPPLQVPVGAELGRHVILLGANLEPAAPLTLAPTEKLVDLRVTLVWQALTEMTTSYRVFLHLLTPEGALLTQSDGELANWTRPTTGWAPGEVVLDERVLSIPTDATPGPYTLVAGLYDPDTRERLALPDGATVVVVTTLQVGVP
jgi:hypothetical protein